MSNDRLAGAMARAPFENTSSTDDRLQHEAAELRDVLAALNQTPDHHAPALPPAPMAAAQNYPASESASAQTKTQTPPQSQATPRSRLWLTAALGMMIAAPMGYLATDALMERASQKSTADLAASTRTAAPVSSQIPAEEPTVRAFPQQPALQIDAQAPMQTAPVTTKLASETPSPPAKPRILARTAATNEHHTSIPQAALTEDGTPAGGPIVVVQDNKPVDPNAAPASSSGNRGERLDTAAPPASRLSLRGPEKTSRGRTAASKPIPAIRNPAPKRSLGVKLKPKPAPKRAAQPTSVAERAPVKTEDVPALTSERDRYGTLNWNPFADQLPN